MFGIALAFTSINTWAQKTYEVTFNTNKDFKMVYLLSKNTGSIMDSALVNSGKAVIKGKTPFAQLVTLMDAKVKGKTITSFFLDGEPIYITQDASGITAQGSELNNKFYAAKSSFNAENKRMMALQEEAQEIAQKNNNKIPDADMERLTKEFGEAQTTLTKALRDAIDNNKDNLIPTAVIASYSESIGMDYVAQYLSSYAFKDNPVLTRVNKQLEAEKRKAVGAMFTDFALNDLEGKSHKLSDYVGKGRYVLLDFWASWCGPCRKEMPHVKKAYEEFHDKGFDIVGVSLDAKKADWERAIQQLSLPWTHLSDLKGWQCEAAALYGVRGIPATILFGPDGKVVATDLRSEQLTAKLREVLK